MGPKKNKKEKMREIRRQGEPSFPTVDSSSSSSSSSFSQNASRIPRPSILLSDRQGAPRQVNHIPASAIRQNPREPKAAGKPSSAKGLRVTFDLSKNKDGPEVMSEEVAECWEDLSDEDTGRKNDEEYVINDDDVIDCEKEFGGIGDEFIDFGRGSTLSNSGGQNAGRGSSKIDFFIGPRHLPGLNDIEDFGAIDDTDDDYGSDYDNVESNRNFKNNEGHIRYFSVEYTDTPPVHDSSVSNAIENINGVNNEESADVQDVAVIPAVSDPSEVDNVQTPVTHDSPNVPTGSAPVVTNVPLFSDKPKDLAETPVVHDVTHTTDSDALIETPVVHDDTHTADSATLKVDATESVSHVTENSNASVLSEKDEPKNSFLIRVNDKEVECNASGEIPFIDGADDPLKTTAKTDEDDDDEWETEQSGGSDESGKMYKFESPYPSKVFTTSAHNITFGEQKAPHNFIPVYDDATMADPPSIGEDDSDIITNEDFDAAFHSVMKEDDDSVPDGGMLYENMETAKIVDQNPFPLSSLRKNLDSEEKVKFEPATSETKPNVTSSNEIESLLEDTEIIDLRQKKPALIEAGVIVSSSELLSPVYAMIDNSEEKNEMNPVSEGGKDLPEVPSLSHNSEFAQTDLELKKSPLRISKEPEKQTTQEDTSVSFVGPVEKAESFEETKTYDDKMDSINVTVGFECRENKPKSNMGSETESEGELVVGEDKCVGTADGDTASDEETVDLSIGDKTSSKDENEMSESRDSLSLRSEDESQRDGVSLALDTNKHKVSANSRTSSLDVPTGSRVDNSPSPEIPVDAPIGNSESSKEKVKKNGKKKGKKNKRDGKFDQAQKAEVHPDRPRMIRGKTWKEKIEKFKTDHGGDALPLSFGNELCESEIVEGTSNLLTENYTEASLLTASRCSTETTIVTETPCTTCSSRIGEFSESESLCNECLRADKKRPADALVQMAEMNTRPSEDNLGHIITVSQMTDIEAVPVPENEKVVLNIPDIILPTSTDKDDFYVVKACEVAVPLEVLTEYVADSESSEEANNKNNKTGDSDRSSEEKESLANTVADVGESVIFVDSSNSSYDPNPAYSDAKDSSCSEKVTESYDYVESFPGVIGTQNISYVYSYDVDANCEIQANRTKLTVKPLTSSLESSGVMMANLGYDSNDEAADSDTPSLTSGEILYEGPCMCGPVGERDRNQMKEDRNKVVGSEDDKFCIPPLFDDQHKGNSVDPNTGMGVETHEFKVHENMGSNPEDSMGYSEGDSKDIRSRIKEIVGPRLHHKRGRHAARRRGGGGTIITAHQDYLDPDAGIDMGARDESPMPGSSPASSSGVQGSDEMSPSRSHSCSPSREDSRSPPSTSENVSELAYEAYQVEEMCNKVTGDPLKTGGEGDIELNPEKGDDKPVDYSFKTFRDMYQINPVYTTDSDDPYDDHQESDTIVQNSSGLSYDPDRSITVSSLGSNSEESPALVDPSTSPPLPPTGGRGTRKVPKVTKQLRETQGIVQRWEVLQAQAVERQRQSSQVRELQRQVKNLRLALENLADQASETPQNEAIENHQQLRHKLQDTKALLEEVRARKDEISSLNLAVHRFFTDSGYTLAQLKDEVNDLYIVYDEAHRRATTEVSRLEGLEATWKLWEAEAEQLTQALRQDGDTLKVLDQAIQTGSLTDSVTASMQDVARLLNDRRKGQQPGKKLMLQHTRTQGVDIQGSTLSLGTSGDDCLSDSGTSGYESCSSEELSERERRLVHLRRLARDLEASLSPDSQAWLAITKTLSSAEMELKGLQKHCRDLVVRSTETLDKAKASPQLRRRTWNKETKVGRVGRGNRSMGRDTSSRGSNGRRGWMWRVVRAALPFQAALLLLFCVACLLEPNCCDTHNSLTMTLTPQLRYVHGPPPV